MSSPKLPLEGTSLPTLRNFVDYLADRYHPVITARFDAQTGVVAIVEGPEGLQVVTLNSGFRHKQTKPRIAKPIQGPSGEIPNTGRNLIQEGPFEEIRGGQRITYMETPEGLRIEYKKTKITRIVASDGTELPLSKQIIKILPNQHHAEMRLLSWAKRNNYRIVAMAPTRGCCIHCNKALQEYFKSAKNFDEAVPKNRQTRGAWRSHLRDLSREPSPGAAKATEFVAKGDAKEKLLRARAGQAIESFKAPNLKLLRVARFLKVAGPAMVAFDAATSYAKAAEQWRTGAKDAATETMAEFGGRAAGAFVGAETFGLLFGGFGSVIPGLGTTVGALAGAVVGGVIGAVLGEQAVKLYCQQVIDWAKGHPHAAGQETSPPATARPEPAAAARRYDEPAVNALQQEMYAAGYETSQVDFACETVRDRMATSSGAGPKNVFEQLGANLPDFGSTAGPVASIDEYPLNDVIFEPSRNEPERGLSTPTRPPPQHGLHPPVFGDARTKPFDGSHPAHVENKTHSGEPRPREPRVTMEVHGTVVVPPSAPGQLPGTAQADGGPGLADFSSRIGDLREKFKQYEGITSGRPDPAAMSSLDADLGKLREMQVELTLSASSGAQYRDAIVQLTEIRNRFEQAADTAQRAEDQRQELIRQQANDERAKLQDQALRDRSAKSKESGPQRGEQAQPRPPDDKRDLQDLEAHRREDAERDRRKEEDRIRDDRNR
jgi:hypothetical protein